MLKEDVYFGNWQEEEMEYYPKRRVNNKISWKIHHLMGSFYSNKMKRTIEYESIGECLFYYALELMEQVDSYYVQPLEIEIPFIKKDGDISRWVHVPDALVFGEGIKPTIVQIKEAPSESEKHQIINQACDRYASNKGWNYQVIYPKKLPKTVLYNINYLNGSLKKQKRFEEWIPEIIYRLKVLGESTVYELSQTFSTKVNPLMIMPVIYHLIASGKFHIDITKKIDENSVIKIKNFNEQLLPYLNLEGDLFENK
ncbi:hypothetical protein [Terrihalobacillus insolitus]|uniref:hypothetical protein n=1 Tax=Terrihalobacillus insolitus TaxID=2950438 RepID=UPI00234088C2|nr:hypothetical protein [Terrihalobacillus insolitus]MDC3414772.1 hypothetical protein [Terrihalobacillus insolitus]